MPISILLFFAILFVLVFVFRLAKVGALAAFLVAGIISGPYVLNLFELSDTWTFLGDLGIIFLWFNLGLEINIKRLWSMRQTIFGFGAAQVLMVAIMMFPILFGLTSWSIMGCIMVALLLAMSSTSEDLSLLTDRNQLNTDMGHQTFSILLFQDLLSIPLLAMLPVFSGKTFNLGATAIDVLVLSVSLIIGVIIVGRFVLNPLMKAVAKLKSKEAFLLVIMLNIIFWSVVMTKLGLPAGLGAFLAGMLVSETIYRHQITAEINPYATLFLAFFFIALGMGLDLKLLVSNWYIILGGTVALMAVKFIAIFMVARVRHVPSSDAAMIALILSQGGEFGLLMLQTLKTSGIDILPLMHQEILTAIIIMSIIFTPILLVVYDKLQQSGLLFTQKAASNKNELLSTEAPEVLICGFGRVGQIVAELLASKGISYLAMDLDVSAVMIGRQRGFNVVYGDSRNADVLRELGLSPRKTKAVVIALDNATTAKDTILTVYSITPKMKIFARARNLKDSKMLLKEGIYKALPETIESSFLLASGVLSHLGFSEGKIDSLLAEMRENNYEKLSETIADNQ